MTVIIIMRMMIRVMIMNTLLKTVTTINIDEAYDDRH